MESIEITDEQYERFVAIQEELAASHAGAYASVQVTDVMAYLLDVAEQSGDEILEGVEPVRPAQSEATDGRATETEADSDDSSTDAAADTADASPGAGGPGMLDLLETHDDKWRETDGEERYEVDLPDGGVETARTRDDVKAILFKQYR